MKLENTTLNMLGKVKKAVSKKEDTTLVEGAGSKQRLKNGVHKSNVKSMRAPQITIKRNCKSGLLSSPAALLLSV